MDGGFIETLVGPWSTPVPHAMLCCEALHVDVPPIGLLHDLIAVGWVVVAFGTPWAFTLCSATFCATVFLFYCRDNGVCPVWTACSSRDHLCRGSTVPSAPSSRCLPRMLEHAALRPKHALTRYRMAFAHTYANRTSLRRFLHASSSVHGARRKYFVQSRE